MPPSSTLPPPVVPAAEAYRQTSWLLPTGLLVLLLLLGRWSQAPAAPPLTPAAQLPAPGQAPQPGPVAIIARSL